MNRKWMTLAIFRGLDDGSMKDESGYMVKMGYIERRTKLEQKEVLRGSFLWISISREWRIWRESIIAGDLFFVLSCLSSLYGSCRKSSFFERKDGKPHLMHLYV